jgi:hypothetical protein
MRDEVKAKQRFFSLPPSSLILPPAPSRSDFRPARRSPAGDNAGPG